MSYRERSDLLDRRLLDVIATWRRTGETLCDRQFDELALALFDYQFRYNRPYARYCASLGIGATTPQSWLDIPPVPATAFKDATVTTFDAARAALAFETSGTTSARCGRHYFETQVLYDAALLAGFDRFMRPDGARLRYLNLVPNPALRPQSSLGYMMGKVAEHCGTGATGWYVVDDAIDVEALLRDASDAARHLTPVCIATTAFALAHVLAWMRERGLAIELPAGSRIMETGGFKGRTQTVERHELYAAAVAAFGIPPHAIVAEYGMTELTSQYYDDAFVRADGGEPDERRKFAPPWMRVRVVGPDGTTLPNHTVGALVHVDLANRGSCIAVATEDLGLRYDDGGVLLVGRQRDAALRGCSLDAETLLT